MTDERALADLFHEVLDHQDVAGPFQRLQIELEKPSAAQRRRGTRRIFMTRNRLVLLAAALVLILGLGLVLSTRVFTLNHAGQTIPAGPKVSVADLLARPLQFTYPQPNLQKCATDGPMTNGLFGAGPVYGQGGPAGTTTAWGAYTSGEFAITSPHQAGPIVMRAVNLRNGQFGVFLDPYGAGPVVGTDTVGGRTVKQYAAIALDTSHPPSTRYDFNGSSDVEWPITQGWPHNSGFCSGFQIDGPDFSEAFFATAGSA